MRVSRAGSAARSKSKQLDQRMRRANFESSKHLEDFEWSFNPKDAARWLWSFTMRGWG
jgi:hypothetical protein